MTGTLLTLGHGYTARALAGVLLPQGWRIVGTTRDPSRVTAFQDTGVETVIFPGTDLPALEHVTHVLVSAGPDAKGDPMLRALQDRITDLAPRLHWVGYLSTTGVYGDQDGAWVDEDTPAAPSSERGRWRQSAEAAWSAIPGLPLHIFRLAGIYGPGRGPFRKIRSGHARRIIKAGQVFSRTHIDDIARILAASIARPNPGAIYNVCDDEPAPPQDVIAFAARLLGAPVPPDIPFEVADLSPMARSFYSENKRVRNARIKTELGVKLLYPDYRAGLEAILAAEQEDTT